MFCFNFLWLFTASLRFYLFGFSFKFSSEYDRLQSGHFVKVKLRFTLNKEESMDSGSGS